MSSYRDFDTFFQHFYFKCSLKKLYLFFFNIFKLPLKQLMKNLVFNLVSKKCISIFMEKKTNAN